MAEDGHKVSLNVYDLSQGLARQLSTTFLGKAIEGIWHTGVVVYGNEHYFGGGIQHSPAGTTPYGTPVRVFDLGVTHVPRELFEEYLQEISPRYTAETYSLLTHNCNNFSNEVAQFLVGNTIPEYILQLPNEVLNSPMGALILPMIQQLESTLRVGGVPQPPRFQPSQSLAPPSSQTNERQQPTAQAPTKEQTSTKEPASNSSGGSEKSPESSKGVEKENIRPKAAEVKDEDNENVKDPLGDARSRVQEEINREFAALMASGNLRASEAAALAMRRVMERYGRLNVTVPQS
ncbi:hypothetical protein AMTRI_Chr07g75800 [Amborella trichopoda]|uniref:PPPDE domain-containing protein n=1 Tax=Amborella trichopoda TaxID=13333 RepID=U5DER6_AMBTC|nr:desumoylating isopeptidase 1 [Amborella trichopoda]XP_020531114.1 desumoylating isopeptidase 1 [Amborella trichopoda]ERN18908.1 hypothetical protein AMTR_s00067p00169770 [Amborella trichopoda]|eukprot:XP_006857441.1 desumoylating isopeptidase 1 [Amborella trichopoda]